MARPGYGDPVAVVHEHLLAMDGLDVLGIDQGRIGTAEKALVLEDFLIFSQGSPGIESLEGGMETKGMTEDIQIEDVVQLQVLRSVLRLDQKEAPAPVEDLHRPIEAETQAFVSERLHEEVQGVDLIAIDGKLRHLRAEDDDHVFVDPAYLLGRLHATFFSQFDIHQDDVRPLLVGCQKGLRVPVVDETELSVDVVEIALEHRSDVIELALLILHDDDVDGRGNGGFAFWVEHKYKLSSPKRGDKGKRPISGRTRPKGRQLNLTTRWETK